MGAPAAPAGYGRGMGMSQGYGQAAPRGGYGQAYGVRGPAPAPASPMMPGMMGMRQAPPAPHGMGGGFGPQPPMGYAAPSANPYTSLGRPAVAPSPFGMMMGGGGPVPARPPPPRVDNFASLNPVAGR